MNPAPDAHPDYHEIACQQILAEDHSVFSIQWVVLPATVPAQVTAATLLQDYLDYIRRFTLQIVRPAASASGLDFRLGASSLPLIRFASPTHRVSESSSRTTLHICGGVLVQPGECDRGQLEFIVERVADGTRITLQLSDFCPLLLGSSRPSPWRKWLYRLTQAYIHKVVTIRFLAMIYCKLSGSKPKTRVVKVALRTGEET